MPSPVSKELTPVTIQIYRQNLQFPFPLDVGDEFLVLFLFSFTIVTQRYALILSFHVPAGSPSPGGDVTVYVVEINQPSLPTLFTLFLCLFLSLWPFQLYFIPKFSRQLSVFSLFFQSDLCLISPFNYVSLNESLLQPEYHPYHFI